MRTASKRMGLATFALLSCISLSSAVELPEPEPPTPQEQFRSLVLDIAEKDHIPPADYAKLASQTVELGQAAMQSGQPLPDSVIHDALDAVEAGQKIALPLADWAKLEEELLALLEKPPEQDQDQQQEQENQEQENSEENKEQQDKQGQEGADSKDQQQQDGEESGEQKDQGQQDDSGEQGNKDQQQQQDQGQNGESPEEQEQKQEGGSKMGKLDDGEEKQELEFSEDDASQEQQDDMQSVGGQKQAPKKVDAEKAVILQKLEQLKQQDDPAKLFQRLQEAESGEKAKQQPNAKDW